MPWVLTIGCFLLGGCNEFFLNKKEPVATDPVVVTETFIQAPLPLVDVLWVVDNTTSMNDELLALAAAAPTFLASLGELEIAWQVGVISMDTTTEDVGVLVGNPWILTPVTDDAEALFADAVSMSTSAKALEAGFAAAYLTLTPPLSTEENRGFRRDGATLQIVFVSDGDDDGDSASVLGSDAEGTFLDFLEDQAVVSGFPTVCNAIVGDVPSGCTGATGQALPGEHFAQAATETGGIVASICGVDFAPVVDEIASASAAWPTVFVLEGQPHPESIRVQVDGLRIDEGWSFQAEPTAIVFATAPLPDAEIVVQYGALE